MLSRAFTHLLRQHPPRLHSLPRHPKNGNATPSSSCNTFTSSSRPLRVEKDYSSFGEPEPFQGGWAGVSKDPFHLPRTPNATPTGVARLFDHVGTVAFASSGAALAGTTGMDMYGCVTIGCITALGGGTIRDVMILARRPFWIKETEYLLLAAGASLLSFVFWPHDDEDEVEKVVKQEQRKSPPLWSSQTWSPWPSSDNPKFTMAFSSSFPIQALDTIGLCTFAALGAQSACAARVPILPCIICGTITATGGGMVRDVFCGKPVRVLHSQAEVYAATAVTGATAYSLWRKFVYRKRSIPRWWNGAGACFSVGFGCAFFLRVWGIAYDKKLPYSSAYNKKMASLTKNSEKGGELKRRDTRWIRRATRQLTGDDFKK